VLFRRAAIFGSVPLERSVETLGFMFSATGIIGLAILAFAYIGASVLLRARQRVLGMSPSKELRRAIRLGIVWINLPVLPILLTPLTLQILMFPDAHAVVSWCLLLAGFAASWAWWSVNVSLWRRWAESQGLDRDALQWEGESSSLLWPKGHFFERTEYDRLRGRRDA
jgi:hypothetical protein